MPHPRSPRPRSPRRGVTLVEMLVAVALLVLMMTVIVQVFLAATSAVSAQRTYQELDSGLRQLDTTIRQDLGNVTARFTPPLDPKNNLGYFEYAENSFADSQGEDGDDTLRFTVKAPEGQIFTGRMYLAPSASAGPQSNWGAAQAAAYVNSQPVTVTSRYAEVIYFLRDGNLYRRVVLVAPEFQSAVDAGIAAATVINNPTSLRPGVFGGVRVSWQGVNDISCHPSPVGTSQVLANTLGDLTNRENRFASPRFASDWMALGQSGGTWTMSAGQDGLPDDANLDTVPDFYPSLYYNVANSSSHTGYQNPIVGAVNSNYYMVNEVNVWPNGTRTGATLDTMAFPYVYPYAYSHPEAYSVSNGLGWIHSPNPALSLSASSWLAYLNQMNHAPLDVGDSLPSQARTGGDPETWWGFPTWRETMSQFWTDPTHLVQNTTSQAQGLQYLSPAALPSFPNINFLPPLSTAPVLGAGGTVPFRLTQPLNTDGLGGTGAGSFATAGLVPAGRTADVLWRETWEDDLIMTGVRSFDVKAYDNSFAGYVDLGWGDDLRLYVPYNTAANPIPTTPPLLGSLGATAQNQTVYATYTNGFFWPWGSTSTFDLYGQTLAHEGRIPPLVWDGRVDPQFPTVLGTSVPNNIGDDTTTVVRLRRVWDSWSTDYSRAPSTGVDPTTGMPIGPPFTVMPVYPSYPPPYAAPLRGLQIQIRVVDPRNERVKVLTIRQDFSDKL